MNELGSEARELLARLGDADGPSDAQTARMKRKLGVALGAASGVLVVAGATGAANAAASAAAAGAAAGAGTKLGGAGLGGLLSMFALGAAAGVGVSTSTLVVRHYFERPVPAVVASSAPALAPAPKTPANAVALPVEPAAAVVGELAPPGEAVAPAPVPLAPGEQPAAAPSAIEPTLGPEVELVIAAKRELTLGRPSQALLLVERLAAEFPNGALREERRLLEVLSLCALGRVEQARREAHDFAALTPRSPLLPRLEQSCGGAAIAGAKPAR
jgi:hypothetical protein